MSALLRLPISADRAWSSLALVSGKLTSRWRSRVTCAWGSGSVGLGRCWYGRSSRCLGLGACGAVCCCGCFLLLALEKTLELVDDIGSCWEIDELVTAVPRTL